MLLITMINVMILNVSESAQLVYVFQLIIYNELKDLCQLFNWVDSNQWTAEKCFW